MPESGVSISYVADVGQINLRGDPANPVFQAAVQNVFSQSLPGDPNSVTVAGHRICWLGPDEWLVLTAADRAAGLIDELESALAGQHAAINDISGGQVLLNVRGMHAADLFAKGCTLDFHPASFKPGGCAQSGLAKANVLFIRAASADEFDIVVRRSFSDYVAKWLLRAGGEFGANVLSHNQM